METRRWTNPALPQTLYIAIILFYLDAAFSLVFGGLTSMVIVLLAAGEVAAGFGIANEKKWGYILGIAIASLNLLPLALYVAGHGLGSLFDPALLLQAIFPIALFALLVHPMSREYQKIWFR